jgi:regulator of sigma E protease
MEVVPKSPAEKAGLKSGDVLLKLDNKDVNTSYEATQIISSHKLQSFPVVVLRDKDTVDLAATPGENGILGISISQPFKGKVELKTYGFFESFKYGWQDIAMITELTFKTAAKVIKGDVAFGQTFTGPIGIAKYATKSAETGWVSFLRFLALLSLSLALLNIMPFPVLDGGHLVIILIEGTIKREIPIKIKMAIQNAGFALLLLLMAFIIYNDIINL